jgi:hypothetical protein
MSFTARDAALTAMLIVQFFALFVAAPFGALGYSALATTAELLLLAYVLLIVLISRSWITAIIALGISGFGLADGIINLLFPSTSATLLTHAAGAIAFVVLGWVVARAVFSPGPVNAHRIMGAIVLYLNFALFFSTVYRLVLDIAPDAFTGLPEGVKGPRQLASVIYFSFVTLTSTGYGDILPINPFARSLANLESIVGVLFPATLLARLVSQSLEGQRR